MVGSPTQKVIGRVAGYVRPTIQKIGRFVFEGDFYVGIRSTIATVNEILNSVIRLADRVLGANTTITEVAGDLLNLGALHRPPF